MKTVGGDIWNKLIFAINSTEQNWILRLPDIFKESVEFSGDVDCNTLQFVGALVLTKTNGNIKHKNLLAKGLQTRLAVCSFSYLQLYVAWTFPVKRPLGHMFISTVPPWTELRWKAMNNNKEMKNEKDNFTKKI